MITSLVEIFIKNWQSLANLTTMSSIQSFEFEDKKGKVDSKRVVVGFATQCAIQSAEVLNEAEEEFKIKCVRIYQTAIKKLQKRTPLKHSFLLDIFAV